MIRLRNVLKRAGLALGLLAFAAAPASAHVWNIGWKSENGGLTFYGVSYHVLNAGLDNFASNPAGFIINGTNVGFDLGSVVATDNCYGPGGIVAGSCSTVWNNLNLDGALHANGRPNDSYRKVASTTLSAAELALLGIGTGSNSVTLSTFANNVDWAGFAFSSASVPLDIQVNAVPVPAAAGLLASVLGLMGLFGWRRRRALA